MLISISGVDCAGKSTQIERLREYFISQGKTCEVVWYRPGYSKRMQRSKRVVRFGLHLIRQVAGVFRRVPGGVFPKACALHVESDEKKRGSKVPAPLWLTSAILDAMVEWGVSLRLQMKKNDVVICDRYFEDGRLDLHFRYPQYSFAEPIFQAIRAVIPEPDCAFLLWLPYETVLERAEAKREPFPDSSHTRKLRYRAYDFLRDDEQFQVIDARGSVVEVHQKILDAVSLVQKKSD